MPHSVDISCSDFNQNKFESMSLCLIHGKQGARFVSKAELALGLSIIGLSRS